MILELIICVVTLCLLYTYWLQNYSKIGRQINAFPGPPILPILGNILDFQTTQVNIFKVFRKFSNTYKTTFRTWGFTIAVLNVTTPEDAEVILTNSVNLKKTLIYEFLEEWLGTGLLTSTGKKWHKRRKLLTPAFHFNILQRFVDVFGEHSMLLVEKLKNDTNKDKVNIMPHIKDITLQSICETSMGITMNSENVNKERYFNSIQEIGTLTVKRIVSPWIHNNFVFHLLPYGWKYKKLIKYLHQFTLNVIQNRDINYIENDSDENNDDDIGKKKKLAMLDLLIHAKNKQGTIDEDGIREEVDTFMFESHDTVSIGMSFILLLLANHKEHQEKVVEELNDIFGESKRFATYEDLLKMNYLELCIKESLRLYPSVPLIGREIEEEIELQSGTVPPKTIINLHIYDIHRDTRYFPNPEKFDPERFLPENSKGRHPYAYIPFSAGLRNCIGQKYAMLEMKSFVSAILRNFILEPVDTPETLEFKLDFVLRNQNNIYIKLLPR